MNDQKTKPYPHSLEAERALLGSVIRDPRIVDELELAPGEFYDPGHGLLWALIRDMRRRGEPVDMVTLPEAVMKGAVNADRYGGIAYVVQLPDAVPATANAHHYAQTIRDYARRRLVIAQVEMLAERAFDLNLPIDRVHDDTVAALLDNGPTEARSRSWVHVAAAVDDTVEASLENAKRPAGPPGLTTGFLELDEKLGGLQAPDLVILAARPAMGKTALALNIVDHAATAIAKAATEGAVAVFSLEMDRRQLMWRMIAARALVDSRRLKEGRLSDAEWDRVYEATARLRKLSIYVDDQAGITIADVRVRARRLALQAGGIRLVVVDYLQLMNGTDPKANRERQIAEVSSGLKALAKDLACPVLALSQLNRIVEERKDKRPTLADLRESGAIEQDADIVLFVFRPEYYFPDLPGAKGFVEVIVAKQRSGPTGVADLEFDPALTKFRDATIDAKRRYRPPSAGYGQSSGKAAGGSGGAP